MTDKVTVNYQGKPVSGTKVEYDIDKEDWNVYKLSDGTILRFKTVVSDIVRLDGIFNNENDPVYLVKSGNIINTNVPMELKMQPKSDEVN